MTQLGERSGTLIRPRFAVGCLIAVLVASPALVKLLFYPAYPGSDDAFIHTAIAEHILRGDGWGILSSDSVNLSSSPLFTVLLLPVMAVGSIGLGQLLSLVFACAALAVTYYAARSLTGSRTVALAALAIAAANVHLWRWSGTVMETSLGYFAVVTIAAVALPLIMGKREVTPGRLVTLGVVIGLGTLVRFEIAVMLFITVGALLVAKRVGLRSVLVVGASFIVALLPWILFATFVFGTPVPTTFYAKASGLHIINIKIVTQLGSVVATGVGLSIAVAAAALWLAVRTVDGRARLRGQTFAIAFLAAWPILLFAFYYLKTASLQSAARYYLPGMATWPLLFALVLAAVSADHLRRYRVAFTAAVAACLLVALAINFVQIRPVLDRFNDGYRAAMVSGAQYLRDTCKPGDVALIMVDIGILARNGIGDCELVDGGALATPALRGLTVTEKIGRTQPTYIVQSIGRSPGEWVTKYPGLTVIKTIAYTDHGVAKSGQDDYFNVYRYSK